MKTAKTITVCDKIIKIDRSGVGRCWVRATTSDLPADIRTEIECEIIDGGNESHDGFRASNGCTYRW